MPTASDFTDAKSLDIVYTVEMQPVVPAAPTDPPFVLLGLGITPTAHYNTSFRSTSIPVSITTYYSDVGYTTSSTDTPADQHFAPYVKSAVNWSRDLRSGQRLGGNIAFRAGEATFINVDGEFNAFLRDYAIDGRTVRVKAGKRDWAYTDLLTLFDNTAETFESRRRGELAAILRGSFYLLQRSLQPNTYDGTGGKEGGADLQGRRKPIALGGPILNAPVPRLNNLNIYDLHKLTNDAGEVQSVEGVFDRGVELTFSADYLTYTDLANASITGGEYATCLAEGFIRLGTEPDGVVTVDFHGGVFDGAFTDNMGDLIEVVLTKYGPEFGSSRLDSASFSTLKSNVTDPVEFWFGPENISAASAIATMLNTFEGYLSDKRDGTFQVGQVKKPDGASSLLLDESDVTNWRWLSLPRSVSPAIDRAEVGYEHNYQIQNEDLAASITEARRTFAAQRQRIFAQNDPNVSDFHQEAQTLQVDSHWATETGADNHAELLLELYSRDTKLIEISTSHKGYLTEIDDVVTLDIPQANVRSDQFMVIGVSVQTDRNETRLVLMK